MSLYFQYLSSGSSTGIGGATRVNVGVGQVKALGYLTELQFSMMLLMSAISLSQNIGSKQERSNGTLVLPLWLRTLLKLMISL